MLKKKQTAVEKWKSEHLLVKIEKLYVLVYVYRRVIGKIQTDNLSCIKRQERYKYSYRFVEE